jgi:apolipoprotein N-acyltransferase
MIAALLEFLSSPMIRRPRLFSVAVVLASSALFFFGTGLHPVWWLTWLAPLPVLLLAPRLGRLQAFAAAALSWSLGSLNLWHYLTALLQVPLAIRLISVGVPACIFGGVVLVHREFLLRGAIWRAVFAVPTLWVAYEYLLSVASPHSTFGNLAYTQVDCLLLLQLASVTGIWGISFCLLLLPATVAALFSPHRSKPQKNHIAIAVTAFLLAVMLYGAGRLNSKPVVEPSVTVALMSSDVRNDLFPQKDGDTLRLLRGYSDQINAILDRLPTSGDRVIILPEKIGTISERSLEEADRVFARAALEARAIIVAGIDRGTQTERLNEARIYSPLGTPRAVYDKHHLIPGFEDVDRPGTRRTLLSQASGTWGIEICKDMDFPQLSHEYGRDRVVLLLVPAWDFVADGWLHDRMAVVRGVESGFSIARSAKQGLLTVTDDRGDILAEKNSGSLPFSVLTATIAVWHDDTLYDHWGDWAAWLSAAVAAGLVTTVVQRRQLRSSAAYLPKRPLG